MNRKLTLIITLALCAFPAWSQVPAQPAYWRYIHPNAKMVVGIDLAAAATSPMGLRVKKEMEQAGMKSAISGQGMDFMYDADQLLISSPADGGAAMSAKTETPVVIVMKGNFELASIRKAALGQGAIPGVYRGISILRTDSNDKAMTLALVSSQIVIAGDRTSVHAAIDGSLSKTFAAPMEGLYRRAMNLTKDNQVWFISETSPGGMAAGTIPEAQMLDDVKGFEGGLSLKSGLGFNFNLNTKSAEAATKLGSGLQAMLLLASMAGPADSGKSAMDLLQKLRVETIGEQVTVAVNYSMDEMEVGFNGLKAELGQAMSGVAKPPTAAPVGMTAPAPPREDPNSPMIVKIYNADGGSQQVDLKKK
jgi:hypothetical protein